MEHFESFLGRGCLQDVFVPHGFGLGLFGVGAGSGHSFGFGGGGGSGQSFFTAGSGHFFDFVGGPDSGQLFGFFGGVSGHLIIALNNLTFPVLGLRRLNTLLRILIDVTMDMLNF